MPDKGQDHATKATSPARARRHTAKPSTTKARLLAGVEERSVIMDLQISAVGYFDRIEIIDYQSQSHSAKEFADKVGALCSANRRRLGYKGYFDTNGDAILTAYLAGFNAARQILEERAEGAA